MAGDEVARASAREPRRIKSGFATVRDAVSYFVGLVIVGHEVFVASVAEPAVIAVGVSLLGLPIVFGADERRRGGDQTAEGNP